MPNYAKVSKARNVRKATSHSCMLASSAEVPEAGMV